MKIYNSPISLVTQRNECPLCNPGGGGILHLWQIKTTGKFFLSCNECDASWETDKAIRKVRIKTFEDFLNEANLQMPQDYNQFQRILDHTLFSIHSDQFSDLINEAWLSPSKVMRNPTEYNVEMGRVIGHKGETKIRLIYNQITRQIVDAYPIPSSYV
jgi:hypothetical protein